MRSKTQKVSKWAILVCCVVMCLCSVATAYAASNVAMGVEEDMVYHTERISIGKSVMDDHEEIHFIETEGSVVEEIFLDEETSPYSSYIQVNTSIPAHTRVSWKKQSMVVGDQVTISIHCEGSGVYWIGIKEIDTGYVYCIEGTGTLTHTFSVPVKGNYRAFIENRSDNEELYRGFIVYPYD